ncbi:MAG: hypothetical protein JSR73_17105 [Proteobacteria bacterium]|nr:hypothetical protein [Pseudomonadota bacterium]
MAAAAWSTLGGRLRRALWILLAALAIGAASWAWLALHITYSQGERAGLLQKFSRKGWLCKTYEGELALYVVAGVQPTIWNFSVRDEAVAQQLAAAVGQRVQLRYAEHRGVPTSCFGETPYFVERLNAVGDPYPAQPLTPVPAPAPATRP